MSLAMSKPKSRSMYYGLTPAEYVAYGGIRTVSSHHSPVPRRVHETSSNTAQSDVKVDGSHVSKSNATKQLNGHQELPSSMGVSATHILQTLSTPRDSDGIVTHSKDVFGESRSEAHSLGIQSHKTSSVDTIKPELPLGLAQKSMQQSTSDVSTPKASYSEAPIPIPKAGEVHTQTESAQSNKSNLGSNVHSIPAVDTKVPNKPHTDIILPVMTDPVVESRPSSATLEMKPPAVKNDSSKSAPEPIEINSHTSNVQTSTEIPVENISPAKPATDTVMKPSIVKAAVIDSATPASLPQASVSVKAPSPNRGTSPSSQQNTGVKDKDVLRT
ncbi:uncharacterized protein LOC143324137, partial [Chaetodon auriga]|uniref:uncharacterized protein LOC143324137 n=1 Tax=Chaetodon auriga TaxID=39042 RepID=UPI004032C193